MAQETSKYKQEIENILSRLKAVGVEPDEDRKRR